MLIRRAKNGPKALFWANFGKILEHYVLILRVSRIIYSFNNGTFKGPMMFKLRYHSLNNKSPKILIAFTFIYKLIQNLVLLRGEKLRKYVISP